MLYTGSIELGEDVHASINLPKNIKCGKFIPMNVKSEQGDKKIDFIIEYINKNGIHCNAKYENLDIICTFKKLKESVEIDYTITINVTFNNKLYTKNIAGSSIFILETPQILNLMWPWINKKKI